MLELNEGDGDIVGLMIHNDVQIIPPREAGPKPRGSSRVSPKKRTFEQLQLGDAATEDTFTIENVIGTPELSTTTTFTVHRRLPRSVLPLSYLSGLDDKQSKATGPSLFYASLPCLTSLAAADSLKPTLCIVSTDASQQLFAIEQVLLGLFSLCPLGSHVTLSSIEELSHIGYETAGGPPKTAHEIGDGSAPWWQCVAATGSEPKSLPRSGNILESAGSNEPSHVPNDIVPSGFVPPKFATTELSAVQPDEFSCASAVSSAPQQEYEEVLSAIRLQYAESLYVSKAPLTYFAKAPLSRARACFLQRGLAAPDISALTETLRSMVLSANQIDKKYREALPDLVKAMPFDSSQAEDRAAILQSMKQPKKQKKAGIRKNGLFPDEEIALARWWLHKDISDVVCDTESAQQECTKSLLLGQKSRETQLQIIVMLEALALETTAQESCGSSAAPLSTDHDVGRSKKVKKALNLDVLLDLFVDRLSIWQTMTSDEQESSRSKDKSRPVAADKSSDSDAKPNMLRQFCVDVVIPFYGARLPEKTKTICQKLGGPKDPTPKRPKLAKSFTMPTQLSGSELKSRRVQAHKSRRTLERVLTDDKLTHRRRISSFSRSSTEPSLPRMKREVSDVPLSAIPSIENAARRYSQREVDLHATSQATEAKVKKKARIEHELQGAIAVLKKPNARMAVKEFVEAADQRTVDHHSRKPLHPRRNPFAPQVMATPSKEKQRYLDSAPIKFLQVSSPPPKRVDGIPPSSVDKVPCSSTKGQQPIDTLSNHLPRSLESIPLIERTPSRGPSRFKSQAKLAQLPLFSGKANMTAFESAALRTNPNLPTYKSTLQIASASAKEGRSTDDLAGPIAQPIQETPLKVHKIFESTVNVQATPTKSQARHSSAAALRGASANSQRLTAVGSDDECDAVDFL